MVKMCEIIPLHLCIQMIDTRFYLLLWYKLGSFGSVFQGKQKPITNNLIFLQVHILSPFIMNGVCVQWKGRINLEKLDGIGCLEFDEERAMVRYLYHIIINFYGIYRKTII